MKVGDKVAVYRKDWGGERIKDKRPHTIVGETMDGRRWFLEEHFTSQVVVTLKEDVEPWKN